MKTLLNKISIWLYKKTKEEVKTPENILYGLKVIESKYIPEGQCIIGTGKANELLKSILDKKTNQIIYLYE